jgi:hypothetical protein
MFNDTIIRLLKPSGSSTQYCDFTVKDTNLSATISNIENTDIGSLFGLGTNEFVLQDLDTRDVVPSVGLLSGSSFIFPQWMIDANDAQSNVGLTNRKVLDNVNSNTGQILYRSLYNGSTFDNNGTKRKITGIWDNGNNNSIGKWYFPKDDATIDFMGISNDAFSNIQPDRTTGFILSTTFLVPTQTLPSAQKLPIYNVGSPADATGWGIFGNHLGELQFRYGSTYTSFSDVIYFDKTINLTLVWLASTNQFRFYINGEFTTDLLIPTAFTNDDLTFAFGAVDTSTNESTEMYLLNHSKHQIRTLGISTTQADIWAKQLAYSLLSIPYTPVERTTADTFFGELGKFGAVSKTDITKHYPATILYKGNQLFQGSLYVNKIITDLKGNTEYTCVLTDINNSLKKSLEALTIKNLDWTDYDHTFTYGNITGSWNNLLKGGDIIYPHVAYGAPTNDTTAPNYQFSLLTDDVTKAGFDVNKRPLRHIDFKPAIRTKVILDKMFEKVGAQYTSSFLTSAPFTNTFVLPSANANLGPVPDYPISSTSQVYQNTGFDTLPPSLPSSPAYFDLTADTNFYVPTYFNFATDTWTIPDTGYYDITAFINYFINGADTNPCQIATRILKNGVELAGSVQVYSIQGYTQPLILYGLRGVFLTAGTAIRIQHAFIDANASSLKSANTITVQDIIAGTYPNASGATFLGVSTGQQSNVGFNVNIGQQFNPEDTCYQLLKGLIDTFNLIIEPLPNEVNKFRIEPYNTWLSQGQKIDWTNKIDLSSKVELKHPAFEQPKTIVFSMLEDNDILNQDAISKNKDKYTYGTYVFQADNDISSKDTKNIGSYFAPTPTTYIPNGPTFIVPHLYQVDQSSGAKTPIQFKPRLLYNLGKKVVPQDALGLNVSTGVYDRGKYWMLNDNGVAVKQQFWLQVSYQSEFPPNFSDGKPLHYNDIYWTPYYAFSLAIQNPSLSAVAKNDLYTTYWGGYINEIYDDEARKMTCNIILDPIEALNLRLNDRYFIMGEYWRINQISNVDLTRKNTTTIDFIKIPGIVSKYPSRRNSVRQLFTTNDPGSSRVGDITQDGQATYIDALTGKNVTDSNIVNFIASKDNLIASSSQTTATFRYNNESAPKQIVDFNNSINIGNNSVKSTNSALSIIGDGNNISPSSTNLSILGNRNIFLGGTSNISISNGNNNELAGYGSPLNNISIINGSNNDIESTLPNSYTPTQNIVAINVSGSTIANINNSNFIGRFQNNRTILGNLYENNTNIVYGKNVMATTAFAEGMWWNAQPSNIFGNFNQTINLNSTEYRNKYNFIIGQKQTTGEYEITINLDDIQGGTSNFQQVGRVFTFTAGANISPKRTINIKAFAGDGDDFYPTPYNNSIVVLDEPGQTIHIVALPINTDPSTQAYRWVVVSRTKAYREASYARYLNQGFSPAPNLCISVPWSDAPLENNISYAGSQITITYPGIYRFAYTAQFKANTHNNVQVGIGLYKDGGAVLASFVNAFAHTKDFPYTLGKSILINHTQEDARNVAIYEVKVLVNNGYSVSPYTVLECENSCAVEVNINWENDAYQLGNDETLFP